MIKEKYFGELSGLSKEQSDAILGVEAELAKVGFPGKRDVILGAILNAPDVPFFDKIVVRPKYLKTSK